MWVNRYQFFATLFLLNVTAVAYAEPEAESEETVSLEFLEFLGEFQTEDGEWIDPVNLLEMEQSQSKRNDEEQTDE